MRRDVSLVVYAMAPFFFFFITRGAIIARCAFSHAAYATRHCYALRHADTTLLFTLMPAPCLFRRCIADMLHMPRAAAPFQYD